MKLSDEQSLRVWCIEKAMSYPRLYSSTTAVEIAQKLYELVSTGRIGELPRGVDGDGDKVSPEGGQGNQEKRGKEMSDE